ncbi:MAG: hypothetical protein SAJ12_14450 [Jaaginema sp. PMC 1079.18]|nr:hypothetical protein [Jaaginema sp. PMC 1080.18]MEC4852185.1 hypothetical protein [Jaaginema sp. PMC 1079.18]MEC4865694.1 hypothetical protein [Jaaginema sp. PMC 1078.18]
MNQLRGCEEGKNKAQTSLHLQNNPDSDPPGIKRDRSCCYFSW